MYLSLQGNGIELTVEQEPCLREKHGTWYEMMIFLMIPLRIVTLEVGRGCTVGTALGKACLGAGSLPRSNTG